MRELLQIFWSFFQIGLFTFGGGYAMLPMLQREVVDKHGWTNEKELLNCYAVAQCTPGVIAVNTATFVGYKRKKILGSLAATVAVVMPSLIIISIIATVLRSFADVPAVAHAFAGIRVAVAALVLHALIQLYQKGVKGALGNALFIASLLVMILTDLSPVIPVLCALVLGLLMRKAGREV
ncbi:MAG: chromate transporter [Oscillospiraceae bacterium]|nr:chromate transporter [Oscillospiraceae bacterium]